MSARYEDTSDLYHVDDYLYISDKSDGGVLIGYLVKVVEVFNDHYEIELISDENDDDIEGYKGANTFAADYELEKERSGDKTFDMLLPPAKKEKRKVKNPAVKSPNAKIIKEAVVSLKESLSTSERLAKAVAERYKVDASEYERLMGSPSMSTMRANAKAFELSCAGACAGATDAMKSASKAMVKIEDIKKAKAMLEASGYKSSGIGWEDDWDASAGLPKKMV